MDQRWTYVFGTPVGWWLLYICGSIFICPNYQRVAIPGNDNGGVPALNGNGGVPYPDPL